MEIKTLPWTIKKNKQTNKQSQNEPKYPNGRESSCLRLSQIDTPPPKKNKAMLH